MSAEQLELVLRALARILMGDYSPDGNGDVKLARDLVYQANRLRDEGKP